MLHDGGTEAEYLESQSDGGAAMFMEELEIEHRKRRHSDNNAAKVGSRIHCANCGNVIIKKSYQSQFCSNKGRGNCKDRFWNTVDDERRERAGRYS